MWDICKLDRNILQLSCVLKLIRLDKRLLPSNKIQEISKSNSRSQMSSCETTYLRCSAAPQLPFPLSGGQETFLDNHWGRLRNSSQMSQCTHKQSEDKFLLVWKSCHCNLTQHWNRSNDVHEITTKNFVKHTQTSESNIRVPCISIFN